MGLTDVLLADTLELFIVVRYGIGDLCKSNQRFHQVDES
jgi:hypothetical protein